MTPYPDEEFETELDRVIERALARLPSLEAEVIALCFGLRGDPLGLDEIADRLHLDIADVHHLKRCGLERLRRASRDEGDGEGGAGMAARLPPRPPSPIPAQEEPGDRPESA